MLDTRGTKGNVTLFQESGYPLTVWGGEGARSEAYKTKYNELWQPAE